MLPWESFRSHNPGLDPYNDFKNTWPVVKLDDLKPVDSTRPVRLSLLMAFTNYRFTQVIRSLEALCRQEWQDFEVLLCDYGSPYPMQPVYDTFSPYLRLKTLRLEREHFVACPSRPFRALLPLAAGEIIAVMQPEVLLYKEATRFLYDAHFGPVAQPVDVYCVDINRPPDLAHDRRWVCLKVGFLGDAAQRQMDGFDWHSDVANLMHWPPGLEHHEGLSHMSNGEVQGYDHWPWWFAGSAPRGDPIWKYLPEMVGHASIDFYLLNFRVAAHYTDISSHYFLGVHQFHLRSSVAPVGEMDSVSVPKLRERLAHETFED